MNETPTLSVIVPCLNEAEGLPELYRRLAAVCRETAADSFEILLIDDGSTDETFAVMKKLAADDPHVAAVRLSRRFGHQAALSAGLSLCKGQRVFILDADLQDPPELLPRFMKKMEEEGADVVFGQRTARPGESRFKRASASFFYRLMGRLGEAPLPPDAGDFRLISRRVVDTLAAMPERSRFLRGMMGWIGLKQVALPYERQPRRTGRSKYPLGRMVSFALDGVTSFSVVPLRIASYIGAALGIAALGLLAYVFRAWLAGETVQGWTSLMLVVLVTSSTQLICLGVFGEYLGRLYMEAKGRPLFIVESIVRGSFFSDNR